MSKPLTEGASEFKEILTAESLFGVINPLMTPFTTDLLGNIVVDTQDLANEMRRVAPFVHGYFPCGNAGEGTDMDFGNWKKTVGSVIETRDMISKDTPVLAGVLRKNPYEIEIFAQAAEKLGANALIISPMYGGNPQEALDTAIRSTGLPIVLYNNPTMHDGKELPLDFIKFAKEETDGKVIGIKSSTENMDYFGEILKLKSPDFKVLQGDTGLALKSLEIGADGIVPAQSTLNPLLFWNLFNSKEKDHLDVLQIYAEEVSSMLELIKSMKSELKLSTAQIIKRMLVQEGVFKSPTMYKS